MTTPQILILGILFVTIVLFFWGRWRHDLVALASLLGCVLLGLVSPADAFSGFGHPAVVTVACVLVMSRGLQDTGAVDRLTQWVLPRGMGPLTGIAALTTLGAVLSAFMNNVGAMALLLPLALQLSRRHDIAPSRVLMPLAFGTILGGMTTLIGTPPNLIVAGFRAESGAGSFGMFDFTPVGTAVALAGVGFVVLVGWRLVPARRNKAMEAFDTGAYMVEGRVGEGSRAAGKSFREAALELEKQGAQIVALVRDGTRLHAPSPRRTIRPDDILVIEAEPDDLSAALSSLGLSVRDPEKPAEAGGRNGALEAGTDERRGPVQLQELVVMPASTLLGGSAASIEMSTRFGLTLIAASRQGTRIVRRIKDMLFQPGDLLLVEGEPESLQSFAAQFNLVPLAARDIRLPQPGKAIASAAIMAVAIALTAFGLLPAPAAFALGALVMGATGVIAPQNLYKAVDWPVIVLLAALMPVAGAMTTTGTADLLANGMLTQVTQGSPVLAMVLLLAVTMTLSDFMNNAATAAVMCPIALSGAQQLGVNPNPLLMAVAIGASCAFLTPIGHQNNTLIMGPGGLRFGDYWRLGLPMEIIVVAVSVPLLLRIWPL